ncbi:MAG: DUF4058 family protein [Coleofasciculus sp. G3-WIS-01]|uniref:DUF4058 family protein n=1 Tax=Coleofasciculus sp. G3-WIS-01 TaxID=3069528 RepID=UPI0032FB542D
MGLLDHFHPPLSTRRHWHAFHNAWATYIASDLNRQLPEGYFAEPNVQFGIEIDVAAFEELSLSTTLVSDNVVQLPTSSQQQWISPPPAQTVPFSLTTEAVEVSIFSSEAGPTLMAAIELVSPSNKDRLGNRKAFVAKCQTYLQQGIGLVVVDVVTGRNANLHEALLDQLTLTTLPLNAQLYAAAYRVVERQGQVSLDIWQEALAVASPLPVMPLWLRGELCLPVDLNATYLRTCREQRIEVDRDSTSA